MYNPHSQAVPYGLATYAQTLHEMKQAMKAFEQQLRTARGKKTELEATVKTLTEKRDAEVVRQEELIEKINTKARTHRIETNGDEERNAFLTFEAWT